MFRTVSVVALSLVVGVTGCKKVEVLETPEPNTTPAAATGPTIDTIGTAEIRDTAGKVLGTVVFSQGNAGVAVRGTISGLAVGEYGMHLHSVGLCEAPEFKSAGGHWNPFAKMHGVSNPAGPHSGDLANLMVTPDGNALVLGVSIGGTFKGDSTSLMDKDGAALVIHAGKDDYKTDPSGNSGARIACGVITAKN